MYMQDSDFQPNYPGDTGEATTEVPETLEQWSWTEWNAWSQGVDQFMADTFVEVQKVHALFLKNVVTQENLFRFLHPHLSELEGGVRTRMLDELQNTQKKITDDYSMFERKNFEPH